MSPHVIVDMVESWLAHEQGRYPFALISVRKVDGGDVVLTMDMTAIDDNGEPHHCFRDIRVPQENFDKDAKSLLDAAYIDLQLLPIHRGLQLVTNPRFRPMEMVA